MFDYMAGGCFLCSPDPDRSVEFMSHRIVNLTGYSADEFTGGQSRSLISLVHPDDVDFVRDSIHQAVSSRRAYEIEYRILGSDGKPRDVCERGHGVYRDYDGQLTAIEGVIVDISAEKQKSYLEQMAIRLAQSSGGKEFFDDCCRYLAEVFGVKYSLLSRVSSDSEELGEVITAWMDGSQIGGLEFRLDESPCGRVLTTGKALSIRSDVQDAFPDCAPLKEMECESYEGIPVNDPEGNLLGVICLVDVKPMCAPSSEALLAKRLLTGRLAVELEREEMIRKLEEARDAAEHSNRTKTRFLANMSHEIRTPLNGILGMATVLEDINLNPETEKKVKAIIQSSDVLLTVLNDILDFSKMEAGQMEIARKPFNLSDCISAAIGVMEPIAADKDLEFTTSISADVPASVKGDTVRLKQILFNLLSNAIKFTRKGKVRLDVSVLEQSDSETAVLFRVEDSGIGMSEEDIEKLFKPFSQVDSSLTRRHHGSGLGLMICRRLSAMMGGTIQVSSTKGVGSIFELIVRLGRVALVKSSEQIPHASPLAPSKRDVRVLVVDDNEVNRAVAAAMLKRCQVSTDMAEDGICAVEAVSEVGENGYDVVFMDVQMPRMDGLEATRAIRTLKLSRQPCIVGLTGNVMECDREMCLEAGMDDYLTKPFTLDQFQEKFQRALIHKREEVLSS